METFKQLREVQSGVSSKIERAKQTALKSRIQSLQTQINRRLDVLDLLLFSQLEQGGVLLALEQTPPEEYEGFLDLIFQEVTEPLTLSPAEKKAITTSLADLIDQHFARRNALPEKKTWGASIRQSSTAVQLKIDTLLDEIETLNEAIADLSDREHESYLPLKISRSVRNKIAGIIKRYALQSTEKGARLSPAKAIEHQVEFANSKAHADNIMDSSLARNTRITTATKLFYTLHALPAASSLSELEQTVNLGFLTDEYKGHFLAPAAEDETELPRYRDFSEHEIEAWNEGLNFDEMEAHAASTEPTFSHKVPTQNLTPEHWQRAVWMLSCESALNNQQVIKNITEFFAQYAPASTLENWYELLETRDLRHLISPKMLCKEKPSEAKPSSDTALFSTLQETNKKTGRKASARKKAIKEKRQHEEREAGKKIVDFYQKLYG